VLHLQAATLGYGGQTVLHHPNLSVQPGERVVILGPSGAGKTTLLSALYRQAGARAALIPQPLGLVGPLSAALNIALGRIDQRPLWQNLRSLCWMPAAERRAIHACAEAVDLVDVLPQAAETLSGGQQSRVAIARALYRGGDLLLADEPCAALDPERARTALQQLRLRFATLICTLHDVDAGLALATRVIGVSGGGIAFDCPPERVSATALGQLYAGEPREGQTLHVTADAVVAPRGCL
jgi:phosphonate transport system ATP-binding protein